jgi:predicted O-methyltransferase YrrM
MIHDLRLAFPWPAAKPGLPEADHGWLQEDTKKLLKESLSGTTRIVVELGSWLGSSARYILGQAPNATLICIDHWDANRTRLSTGMEPEPDLYQTFMANCWDYRDRLIPIRTDTVSGLHIVHDNEVEPDVVYIDASHDYEAVLADIRTAVGLFPRAVLVGDDWDWPGVQKALTEIGVSIKTTSCAWKYVPEI